MHQFVLMLISAGMWNSDTDINRRQTKPNGKVMNKFNFLWSTIMFGRWSLFEKEVIRILRGCFCSFNTSAFALSYKTSVWTTADVHDLIFRENGNLVWLAIWTERNLHYILITWRPKIVDNDHEMLFFYTVWNKCSLILWGIKRCN